MHPIFALSNPARLRAIHDDFALSVCLHEGGHAWVARALGAPYTTLHLPDLSGRTGVEQATTDDATPPAVLVNAAGLSRTDRISVLLGGYAGELCLYDRDYVASGGAFATRLDHSGNDAAGLARILGRPEPTTIPSIERVLVEALIGVRHRPYALLARDLAGFRRWVSRLHAAWEQEGFRGLGLRADLLPDAA